MVGKRGQRYALTIGIIFNLLNMLNMSNMLKMLNKLNMLKMLNMLNLGYTWVVHSNYIQGLFDSFDLFEGAYVKK